MNTVTEFQTEAGGGAEKKKRRESDMDSDPDSAEELSEGELERRRKQLLQELQKQDEN